MHIKAAAPQAHESVGLAERTVRRFKEMTACIRSDMRAHGYDLTCNSECYHCVMQYIAQTHNHFGLGSTAGQFEGLNSRRTPIELVLQKDRPSPACSLFGSVVHARVPDSLAAAVPEATRFVPAAYLYIRPNSLARMVSTRIGSTVHTFQAEIKSLSHVVWDSSLAPALIKEVARDEHQINGPAASDLRAQHDQVDLKEGLPTTGPPRAWIREHGPSENCTACNSSSRHGRKHSASCCRRYRDWVESERKKMNEPESVRAEPSAHQQGVSPPGQSELPHPDESHPTGRIRYHQKLPPVVPGDRGPTPESAERSQSDAVPKGPNDFEPMEIDHSYEPSLAPDDMDVNDDVLHESSSDPLKMPMDVSAFLTRLTPRPEELVHDIGSHGIYCPIYVPSKYEEPLRSEPFDFCGHKVYLIEPELGISEDGHTRFTPESVKAGRLTELNAMNKLEVGEPIREEDAKALAKELGLRIIGSRWVLTSKTIDGLDNQCRARCVVQDVATGSLSAQHLGISSSTPSVESLRSFLAACHHFNLWLAGLDVSTAFLHSELPAGIRSIVRMPADVSFKSDGYSPVCVDLYRAMNGLRVASKAWLNTCARILKDNAGLWNCPSEPTILAGTAQPSNAPSIVLVYVDDLLVASTSRAGIKDVRSALEVSLKVKTAGEISNSNGPGGKILFLGREVIRPQYSESLYVRVPPSYLEELFTEDPFCMDLKASPVPADLLAMLEKGFRDPGTMIALSDEASARYKRIVGKLAWWSQTRPDHARFISLLATGQSAPTNIHENMLRKYLRFVRSVAHLYQKFPADCTNIPEHDGIVGVSDASWGSSDVERRKSISGGVIYWKGSVIKAYSRMQHCITLSSCESEVIAVCQISQECIGLRHLVEFLESFADPKELARFHECDITVITFDQIGSNGNRECFPIIVLSDSQSCLAALKNQGLSRRVRHMSLATCFIQTLVESGHLVLVWVAGKFCVADLLTKILGRDLTEFHRSQMGIIEVVAPEFWQHTTEKEIQKKAKKQASKGTDERPSIEQVPDELADVQPEHDDVVSSSTFAVSKTMPVEKRLQVFARDLGLLGAQIRSNRVTHVVIELFTTTKAGFSQLKGHQDFKQLGIVAVTEEFDLLSVRSCLIDWVHTIQHEHPAVLFATWCSPPCTGGSPVLNLIPMPRRAQIQEDRFAEFLSLMNGCEEIMQLCPLKCLELSKSCTYWSTQEVIDFCVYWGLKHTSMYPRCAYDDAHTTRAKHMYRVASNVSMCIPRKCSCKDHQGLNHQSLERLGHYPRELASDFAAWLLEWSRASIAAA